VKHTNDYRHSRTPRVLPSSRWRVGGNPNKILASARMTSSNQQGFAAPILFLGAFLILFITVTFIKIGTLNKIDPDLSRIGINLRPSATPNNLAQENISTNPTQIAENPENTEEENSITASSTLDVDSDIEGEGDNPAYIE
jgi:hypothetical protein